MTAGRSGKSTENQLQQCRAYKFAVLIQEVGTAVSKQKGDESRIGGRPGTMHDLNVLALFKGKDRYIFVYDDAGKNAIVDAVRNCASDPATAFNWFDAAVLTERAERQAQQAVASGNDAGE